MRASFILFLTAVIGLVPSAQDLRAQTPSESATASAVSPPAVSPQALEAAVRQGDAKAVERLLKAGVDANAELRNGFTVIFHAVDRDRLNIVKLLLEHGARIDREEGFFHSTPLERALSDASKELVLLLLQHEPGRLDNALSSDDIDIVRAALRIASPLYEYQRAAALADAKEAGRQEIVELLAATEAQPGLPEVSITPEQLATLVGTYSDRQPESPIWTFAAAPGNKSQGQDSQETAHAQLESETRKITDLVAVSDRELRSRSNPTHGVVFWGRGSNVETLLVFGDREPIYLRPIDDDSSQNESRRAAASPKEVSDVRDAQEQERSPEIRLSEPWASFRGPGGSGIADGMELPTTWDLASGENVLWKTRVPGLGLGSPITDGERIYLTTAISSSGNTSMELGHYGNPSSVDDDSTHTWKVLAYDAPTGELAWQRQVAEARPGSKRHLKSSQANSTAVTDGEHVVAVLPTAGLVCYRATDGELLWQKSLGALPSGPYGGVVEWGFAASPLIWHGKLILQADIHGGAFIAAWDVKTGEQLWRTPREEIPTWSTPILFEGAEGPELVTNGTTIRGYDPRDGRELWSLGPNSEVIVSSPVADSRLIYITGGYPPARPVYAVRPGSRGDISLPDGSTTSPALAWSKQRGGVYIPTPLVYRGVLYLIHGQGRIEALDTASGERLYRARLSAGGTVSGSAIAADGLIYVPTEEGQVYVIQAGSTYAELAVNTMGEGVMTVPAPAQGTLFIRGLEHLIAIRNPKSQDLEKSSQKK